MSVWTLVQIVVNLILFVGVASLWMRMRRPPKDDPRLSRGLQLLQSKISVLEDLSDRTDRQVNQLTKLLENKARQLQNKFFEAEKQVQKLQSSMDRSMEVASIFQDKIPHSEIIERQNTIKHVQAARMANKGHSVDDILAKIDLPKEQVEFIAKVNKDQLVFDESQLPAWIEGESPQQNIEQVQASQPTEAAQDEDHNLLSLETIDFDLPQKDYSSLQKLGEQFKEACQDFETSQQQETRLGKSIEEGLQKVTSQIVASPAVKKASQLLQNVGDSLSGGEPTEDGKAKPSEFGEINIVASEPRLGQTVQTVRDVEVKKVEFPKINLDDNLG